MNSKLRFKLTQTHSRAHHFKSNPAGDYHKDSPPPLHPFQTSVGYETAVAKRLRTIYYLPLGCLSAKLAYRACSWSTCNIVFTTNRSPETEEKSNAVQHYPRTQNALSSLLCRSFLDGKLWNDGKFRGMTIADGIYRHMQWVAMEVSIPRS